MVSDMVDQNKTFSFEIKGQAKKFFLSDVEMIVKAVKDNNDM